MNMMLVFFFNSFYCLFVILLWSQIAGVDIFAMFPCTGRIHEAVIFS